MAHYTDRCNTVHSYRRGAAEVVEAVGATAATVVPGVVPATVVAPVAVVEPVATTQSALVVIERCDFRFDPKYSPQYLSLRLKIRLF